MALNVLQYLHIKLIFLKGFAFRHRIEVRYVVILLQSMFVTKEKRHLT
jgi:hypothetical protein